MTTAIEALTSGGKRQKTHDAQLVIKLPESAKALVKDTAKADNVSDAHIVRLALAEYFERRGITG